MSIDNCVLFLTKEKIKIAQNSTGGNNDMQIRNSLPIILEGSVNDRIKFDDKFLSYIRTKDIIFISISLVKYGDTYPQRFLSSLMRNISDLGDVKDLLKEIKLKELCLQPKLKNVIDECINEFNSEEKKKIAGVQSDVNEITKDLRQGVKNVLENIEDLDDIDRRAKNLKLLGNDYKINGQVLKGETRICKPWMLATIIIGGILLLIILTYITISLIRCGNLIIVCDKN